MEPLTFDRYSEHCDNALMFSVTGKVNDAKWKGYEARTVLFLGCTSRCLGKGWRSEIRFQPAVGWDLTTVTPGGAHAVYQVYGSADFAQLEPLIQTVRQEDIIKVNPLENGSVVEYRMNVYTVPACRFLRAGPVRTRIVGAK